MKNQNLSRRDFVKIGALSAGMLALGSVNTNATMNSKDIEWNEEEFDVVVIGSGFAGLSAALKSAQRGLKVAIIEKMGRLGGNSVISGGGMAVINSELQEKNEIKDCEELFIKDCMKAGLNINDTKLLSVISKRSKDAYNFVKDNGAKFSNILNQIGGHSVPRSLAAENGSGSGIIFPLIEALKNMKNVKIMKRTKFDDFVINNNSKIVGVRIRENYKFDFNLYNDDRENNSGDIKFIKVNKGLILAAGGFCCDKFYRAIQDPRIASNLDTTNQPGATAGVLLSAFALGATPVQVSWLQFIPNANPDEKGFGTCTMFNSRTMKYGICVNPKTGERFCNEISDRKKFSDAMFEVIGNSENYPINICDSDAVKQIPSAFYDKAMEGGIVKKFDTIDDIAKYFNIKLDSLKKTIKRYNDFIQNGNDLDFNKPINKEKIGIMKAPFYANRSCPKLHHTMGGLKINTKAQVISSITNEPIPGLYAAGEITGGIHGASRLGTVAIADCLTFGMIAGENV